jgi:2-aminoadipate transaminase
METTLPFAERVNAVRGSRIREILKVTDRPGMISFAGGMPDPRLLPAPAIRAAADRVLTRDGEAALQYSISEGLYDLRAWIAERYRARFGLNVSPASILITNGSQQALDLIGKLFLEKNTPVYLERPSYLGAIQAFALYEPRFVGVGLHAAGTDTDDLRRSVQRNGPGLFYSVPNFQNPAGTTTDLAGRERIAALARTTGILPVEDDPYSELRFNGRDLPPIRALYPPTLLLGSFSKIVAPGMRLGWIVAGPEVMRRLVAVKQASDLHTNVFAQKVLLEFLREVDLERHIAGLRAAYGRNRDAMVDALRVFWPAVRFVVPEGGMFLWCELPPGASAEELATLALEANVALVPGGPFFIPGLGADAGDRFFRLNFSNSTVDEIKTGIRRLAALPLGVANERANNSILHV